MPKEVPISTHSPIDWRAEALDHLAAPLGERYAGLLRKAQDALLGCYTAHDTMVEAGLAIMREARQRGAPATFAGGRGDRPRPLIPADLHERFRSGSHGAFERAMKPLTSALESTVTAIEGVEAKIAEALTHDRRLDTEVRQFLRARKAADRRAVIAKAIEVGDKSILAAINAPGYLSGLTDDEQGEFRLAAAKRFAPEAVAAREHLTALRDQLLNCHRSFTAKATALAQEYQPAATTEDARAALDRLAGPQVRN